MGISARLYCHLLHPYIKVTMFDAVRVQRFFVVSLFNLRLGRQCARQCGTQRSRDETGERDRATMRDTEIARRDWREIARRDERDRATMRAAEIARRDWRERSRQDERQCERDRATKPENMNTIQHLS